jgi:hypothetical protein
MRIVRPLAALAIAAAALTLPACGGASHPAHPATPAHSKFVMPTFEQASAQAVSLLQRDGYSVIWTLPDAASGGGPVEAAALGFSNAVGSSGTQYEEVLVSPLPDDASAQVSIIKRQAPAGLVIRQNGNVIWVNGNAGQMNQLATAPPPPTPSSTAPPAPGGDPTPGSGTGPACTTIACYYPGGLPGHTDSSGLCVPDKP